MSSGEEGATPPEIVIIRRKSGDGEEGHHGGMWKIAFADFMTAMMAFFLVMWLVNATDQQTLAQVSTYFNPIKLTDRTTTERGVQDNQQGGTGETGKPPSATEESKTPEATGEEKSGQQHYPEEALFADPDGVLAKLAEKAVKLAAAEPAKNAGARQEGGEGQIGGDVFRDPFDPDFRHNSNVEGQGTSLKPMLGETGEGESPAAETGQQANLNDGPVEQAETKKTDMDAAKELVEAEKEKIKDSTSVKPALNKAAEIETELAKQIQEAKLEALPGISVTLTPEGVLISMTDQADFEMFAISSAEPRPELVVLMEKLAKILSTKEGELVVRGHTDGRPFRSKTYDNWRLSTARAHIAYHMLQRGGLEKERFARIEGYADRELLNSEDPNAAENRRIEVLLRPAES